MQNTTTTPNESPIARACRLAGGGGALARLIGESPSFVSQLVNGRRPVPNETCVLIEFVLGGAVTANELNSDERWGRLPDSEWPHPKGRPVVDYGVARLVGRAAPAANDARMTP